MLFDARNVTRASQGPAAWVPALIALGLTVALGMSTSSGGLAGHTPLLWFLLLTFVCVRERKQSWVVVLYLPALVLFSLWFASAAQSVTIPLGVGLLLAYVFDPVVDRLERHMSRSAAIALLAVPILALLALLVTFLVPALLAEGAQLVRRLPELQDPLERLGTWAQARAAALGFEIERATLADWLVPRMEAIGHSLLGASVGVWRGVQGVVAFVSFLVITPVVSFYLLRDIDRIRDGLEARLPEASRPGFATFSEHVNRAVSGYLRGQLLVGLMVGASFAIGLTALGMDYALLVGLSAVVLNLIPYVGSVTTAILALSVALLSDPSWTSVVKVASLYAFVQLLDGVVSPRIMGQSLSLHPVVVMLAVLIAGHFLGLVGVILAVPATAVLKEAVVLWAPELLALLPLRRDLPSSARSSR